MGLLILDSRAMQSISEYAESAYPRECCGLLFGHAIEHTWRVVRAFAVKNIEPEGRDDRYVMDVGERRRGEAQARESGLNVVGFYHSHPNHDVYFSPTDLENCEEVLFGEPWLPPTYAYLVVSVKQGKIDQHGAFFIQEGAAHPLNTRIS